MATSAPSAPSGKPCYNKDCTEAKPERPRKGWRLHNGDYAELCGRCASLYDEGRFCDIFHVNASGWRTCESCGKKVHCGCIVSVLAFTLLDPGGIECVTCARKDASSLAPNPAWPTSMLFHASSPEKFSGLCGKNWNQIAGTGPVPWRQAPSLFNSIPRAEMQPRVSYDIEGSTSIDRLVANERYPTTSIESKRVDEYSERFTKNVKISLIDNYNNGSAGPKSEVHLSPYISNTQHLTSLKEEHSTPAFGLSVPYASLNETNGHLGVAGPHFRPAPPPTLAKHFYGNMLNDNNPPIENPMRNGRPRGDPRGKSQLLPRYWPRITDQELQQISGDSNSVITPLFEKMLSVSDAGKIGRLVLPKKCAEAYFPPISHPEGLPLKVQDAKGSEWTFQFRFWPNNNSRMYVLEGVTPCIQSMQLQAGDIVTFSRLVPEGKLIMGFRKATAAPSDQETEAPKGEVADPNSWSKGDKSGYMAKEVLGSKSSLTRKRKSSSTLGSKSKRLRIEDEDVIELKLTWDEAQALLRPPPNPFPSILMIEGFEFEEYEDAPVLGKPTLFTTDHRGDKIQWVQCEECMKWRKLRAECLLPSRWTCAENIWDPERSFCSAAQELTSEQIEDVLFSSATTPTGTRTNQKTEWRCGLKKKKKSKSGIRKQELEVGLEGLDALAHMAIIGEGGSSCQAATTTKHPRHRPGCTCIVCIQPPSGKGPKHKQTCTCNVCVTVKRRFRTLMLRREKKQQLDKREAAMKKKQPQTQIEEHECVSVLAAAANTTPTPNSHRRRKTDVVVGKKEAASSSSEDEEYDEEEGEEDDEQRNKLKSSSVSSPFKCGIDLNIQPEREEELSPNSDPSRHVVESHQDEEQQQLEVPPTPTPTLITSTSPSTENRDSVNKTTTSSSTHQEMPPAENVLLPDNQPMS